MTLIRKLVLALCWALWSASYSNAQTANDLDPSQTYATGNIVVPTTTTSGSTWTNGVYQDSLTCWSGGDPGYCGPNPIVRPGGNINFSYGWTDLYQQQQIAAVLPYSGTGLRVDGYNFGFTAKNGNGWDDGRTDLLYAYVQFDGPNGTVLNNTTNLSYQFNWTTFNLNQTFAAPYSTEEVTSVRYGFVGRDNNFWAGPYGPEIADVSFSLRYSVDPCVNDPLYSSTCPGYLTALQALIPALDPVVEATPLTAVVAAEPAAPADTPATPAAQTAATQESQGTATEPAASSQTVAAQETSSKESEKKSTVSLSTILSIVREEQNRISSVESAAVQSSVAQAFKEAEQLTADAEAVAQQNSSQSQEAAQASSEQSQQQTQTTASTGQSSTQTTSATVAQAGRPQSAQRDNTAAQQEEKTTDNSDSTLAQTVKPQDTAVETKIESNTGAVELQQPSRNNGATDTTAGVTVIAVEQPRIQETVIQSQTENTGTIDVKPMVADTPVPAANQGMEIIKPPEFRAAEPDTPLPQQPKVEIKNTIADTPTNDSNASVYQSLIPQSLADPVKLDSSTTDSLGFVPNYSLLPQNTSAATEPEMPQQETYRAGLTTPANDFLDSKQPQIDNGTTAQTQTTVKKNVQNNELAGAVGIESISVLPQGYNQYAISLADRPFYPDREIYRGQKTVDNVRALRQLASDKLHEEMVNQQYQGAK